MPVPHTNLKQILFLVALYGLIAIWNIPHTIAARYAFEGLLLILLITTRLDWRLFFSKAKLLLVFFAYLFLQIAFFSSDLKMALSSFKSEWMHFILFSVIGAGAGLLIGQRKHQNLLLYLGLAFAAPLLLHLSMSIIKAVQIGDIPWRYWGIHDIHGDLGYAGLQASILFTVYLLTQASTRLQKIVVVILLLACVVSPLIAQSRGGVLFVVLASITTFIAYYAINGQRQPFRMKYIAAFCLAILCVGGIIKMGITVDPNRWGSIFTKAMIGLHGDPKYVYCDGIESLRESLRQDGVVVTPEIERAIKSVEDGDGARIMAARSGLHLLGHHPMGINGSKQAYQMAITRLCGKPPAIFMSHTHNAWIDTALAIGIPGAILLLLVMLNYAFYGYQLNRLQNGINPFAFALLISACVWILRGALDSTLRDQMLEMQAFTLAFLLAAAIQFQATRPLDK
jgi:hypothetical protein